MFDLETAIQEWRNELAREGTFAKGDLDELEDHLRAAYKSDIDSGLAPAAAFERSRDDIGAVAELSVEFGKLERTSWRRYITAGWAAFALSFFLPVHQYGISLYDVGLLTGNQPGFEAFVFAFSGELGFVGIVSALTNLLMLVTMWRVADRDRNGVVLMAGLLTAAAFLNLWWVFEGIDELRIGYYAWAGSFASVASGLILRAKELVSRATPVLSS